MFLRLSQNQPGHKDEGNVQENLRQKLILVKLARILMRWIPAEVAKVERRREKPKRERPDAERHVEATVAGKALETLRLFRFGTLAGRSRWGRFSWIFLATATTVQWNDLFLAD